MSSNRVRLCLAAFVIGLAGCGETTPEPPDDYGEQVLTSSKKATKKGPPPIPRGMESAETRSEKPAP